MRRAGNSGRSMAILAMSRRAILALPWLGKPTGKMPVVLMGKMPVVLMGKMPMLRLDARADLVGGVAPAAPAEDLARSWSWGLSSTGNWNTSAIDGNSQARTHDNANQITSMSGVALAPLYDQAGNNVRGPRPADPNANNAAHFRYDAWNRLSTVHLDDGNTPGTLNGTNTLLATYRYDGLNRRVMKVTHDDPNTTTGQYMYFNENWQIVEVRRGVNQTPTAAAYKQFVYDIRYIDAPVCRWWDADSDGTMEPAAGEMQYFTNDGNFNTTALVDANSGGVVERYLYDPYGRVTVLNGAAGAEKDPNVAEWSPDADNKSDWDNDILYCGYQYDPVTGLYHVRERYYDPVTGTWKTRDRILYPDGMNLYEYVISRPTGLKDPSGTKWVYLGKNRYVSRPASGQRDNLQELAGALTTGGVTKDDWVCIFPNNAWKRPQDFPTACEGDEANTTSLESQNLSDMYALAIDLHDEYSDKLREYHHAFFKLATTYDRVTRHYISGNSISSQTYGGRKPLRRLAVFGHGGGGLGVYNKVNMRVFSADALLKAEYKGPYDGEKGYRASKYEQTKARCWFRPGAKVELWSCYGVTAAKDLADKVLRTEAIAGGPRNMIDMKISKRGKETETVYVRALRNGQWIWHKTPEELTNSEDWEWYSGKQ